MSAIAPEFSGYALLQARKAAGIDPRELARRARVSPERLHQLERGRAIPTFDAALRLAAVLRVPVTELAI